MKFFRIASCSPGGDGRKGMGVKGGRDSVMDGGGPRARDTWKTPLKPFRQPCRIRPNTKEGTKERGSHAPKRPTAVTRRTINISRDFTPRHRALSWQTPHTLSYLCYWFQVSHRKKHSGVCIPRPAKDCLPRPCFGLRVSSEGQPPRPVRRTVYPDKL